MADSTKDPTEERGDREEPSFRVQHFGPTLDVNILNLWSVVRNPRQFIAHVKTGHCPSYCFGRLCWVTLPYTLYWALIPLIGWTLGGRHWLSALALTVIALQLRSYSIARSDYFTVLRASEMMWEQQQKLQKMLMRKTLGGIGGGLKEMLEGLFGPGNVELMGSGEVAIKMERPADEDPIDKIIRESQELARKNAKRDRGDGGMVS